MTAAERFVDLHFSSKDMTWTTPRDFFDALDAEFHFTLDAAASHDNALCPDYYTEEMDGLQQPWRGRVFCNPPYGRTIGAWIRKASREARLGALVVLLIPARTETSVWHDYIFNQPGVTVRFIRGRLKFGGSPHNAPFPSAVVVFAPHQTAHAQGLLLGAGL